jgi:hypothetical protein
VTIIDEFAEHASVLRNLHFEEASPRLAGLFDWMEQQPPLQNILAGLRKKADGLEILLKADSHHPPPASTPDQIAAVGLTLMEACRNEDFGTMCLSRGIGPSYNTPSVQAYVDAGLQRYVIPLLRYIERELKRADAAYMPARIAERKFDDVILGPAFAAKFPQTHEHLKRVSAEFVRPQETAAWQNVGNSCRQAMGEFCRECCQVLDVQLTDDTKRGDVKAIVHQLISMKYSSERFAAALERIIVSVWDYAQSLTHRSNATREEALRAYLWTGLAIDEIATLLTK